jgi:hypothetical protein
MTSQQGRKLLARLRGCESNCPRLSDEEQPCIWPARFPWPRNRRANTRSTPRRSAGRDQWTTGSNVTAAPLGTPARVWPCLILSARCGQHVGVAKVIVNNNPETMTLPLRSFRTAASWCFAQAKRSSSRPSAARAGTHSHRRVIMGPRNGIPATHSASQTRVNALLLSRGAPRGDDRSRTRWVRSAKMRRAPAPSSFETRARAFDFAEALACAPLRMRTGEFAARRRTVLVIPSSRCQTAHLVPAAHVCARVLQLCFINPRVEGWAERRETFGCSGTRGAYHDAIRQAPSEAPCVP